MKRRWKSFAGGPLTKRREGKTLQIPTCTRKADANFRSSSLASKAPPDAQPGTHFSFFPALDGSQSIWRITDVTPPSLFLRKCNCTPTPTIVKKKSVSDRGKTSKAPQRPFLS